MFKVIAVCSLVMFANAGVLPDQYEEHAPANYDFSYSVHDGHTGDVKQQEESRRGDSVQGSYSLVEPDGHKRVVHYTADEHNGFNAVVQREGTVHQAQIAHAPVAVAHAPVAVAHAAPAYVSHAPVAVAHAAPALTVSHAPVAVAHAAPAIAYSSHGNAISHQTFSHSAPVVAHQTYAAQPQIVSHQIAAPAYQAIQPLGYASQGYAGNGYASHGYANQGYANQGYAGNGYSTVSQVTHHGDYHH